MDSYDQQNHADDTQVLDDTVRASDDETQRLPVVPDFHKELVKFAVYFSGTLVPLLFAMDEIAGHVQQMFTHITIPLSDESQQHTVSMFWAQIFVGAAYVCLFAIYWFSRNYFRYKHMASQLVSQHTPNDGTTNPMESHHEAIREKEAQISKFSQQLDQQRFFIKKIQAQMYDDNVRARHDFVSFKAVYILGPNGDIEVRKEVVLRATELDVHFWRFAINGEDLATSLEDFSEMDLQVEALNDDETNVIPLVLEDRPTRKAFTANFLPAISPGRQRSFVIRYRWPGFFNELLQRGSTRYYWDSNAYTHGARADFWTEWRFDKSYGHVGCESTGANPSGMALSHEDEAGNTVWRYVGDQVPFGNIHMELHFTRKADK
jgi:hypothetical protein